MSHTLVIKGDLAQLKDVALKLRKELDTTLDGKPIAHHNLRRNPTCPICHCTCSSYSNLQQHIETHPGTTPRDAACDTAENLATCIAATLCTQGAHADLLHHLHAQPAPKPDEDQEVVNALAACIASIILKR